MSCVRLDLKTVFIILSSAMYVCICRAVKEETVRAAIEGGAHSVEAVTDACCAGDDCGACHQVIEDMIEAHTGQPSACHRFVHVIAYI